MTDKPTDVPLPPSASHASLRNRGKRPTLKTIATITGLGVTTVSRALKDGPEIAEETKRKVRQVASEVGYYPDRAGVRLRTGKTNVISLVLNPHDEVVGYGSSVILGLSQVLSSTPYHLVVTPHFLNADPMDSVRYITESGSADGIVFSRTEPMDPRVRYLMEIDFPFVSHGRTELATEHPYHDYDNAEFSRLAARRLIEKGRKRLVLIAPPTAHTYHQHMTRGFADTVREAGVEQVFLSQVDLDSTAEQIRTSIRELVKQGQRPDGFVCGGEISAIALMAGLADAGLKIGEDVDIVAKQTSSIFNHYQPQIDTIYEDLTATGQELANIILRRLDDSPVASLQTIGTPELRFRTSSSADAASPARHEKTQKSAGAQKGEAKMDGTAQPSERMPSENKPSKTKSSDTQPAGARALSAGKTDEAVKAQITSAKKMLRRNKAKLKASFAHLSDAMKAEIDEIKTTVAAGRPCIPELDFATIRDGMVSDQTRADIRKRGAVVIRGVFDRTQAEDWNEELGAYIDDNGYYEKEVEKRGLDKYFDELASGRPQIFGLYWSKPQIMIRQAETMAATKRFLNGLWDIAGPNGKEFDPDNDYTYADRIRRREPGDKTLGLSPHMDAGSYERWTDPAFQTIYEAVFAGDWQAYDPWNAAERTQTIEYPSPAVCSMFRTFQGWTGLTTQGPNDGTLQLVPSAKAIAYMLLRALQDDVAEDDLCGALPGRALSATEEWHPLLLEGLISIPTVEPGDTVWWHPDVIHAVEDEHNGAGYSNVVYVGASPRCAKNTVYARKQARAFIEGLSAPDFAPENYEVNFKGRATASDLTELGREQMALDTLV
ncbi:YbiU family protein [Denitrobaculum tricleocarpae]|uniref:DUF1479 family protein n=1 Tax=Denitrobaculum tricleocarpae TaxID=2591009 RepID=A0A545TTN5_9PROT|nr:YbiU family protein [Denitrobaculum tricleocarpae]TQV80587.1 DUF1479 family protein [Denitrobaculum tricleocarpae]